MSRYSAVAHLCYSPHQKHSQRFSEHVRSLSNCLEIRVEPRHLVQTNHLCSSELRLSPTRLRLFTWNHLCDSAPALHGPSTNISGGSRYASVCQSNGFSESTPSAREAPKEARTPPRRRPSALSRPLVNWGWVRAWERYGTV